MNRMEPFDLQVFNNPEFGQVRTITEDGKTLFCGNDVAKSLGYSNPRDALERHCRGVVKRDTPTASGTQTMSFIPFAIKECVNDWNQWSGTQTLITPKGRETFRLLLTASPDHRR